VSHSVAVGLLTPALLELSRVFPCLQIDLRRGSGPEVAEWLKSGETELAIAGPLGEAWPRLDAFPMFDEPLDLFVSRKHRLSGRTLVEFKDLASEAFLIDTQCELATQISDHLKAKGVADTRVHRVATQNDLLTLLEANLGIAVVPVGAALSDGLSRVPLMEFDLVHTVSAYCVAGRRRGTACASLFKMLRASDWGVETVPERKLEVHQ
jgi:DNA-binding transcriptional LysR family regulator